MAPAPTGCSLPDSAHGTSRLPACDDLPGGGGDVATDIGTRKVSLAELRARAGELATIGARHGVGNLRVFGSVARAEADEDSDVDLLVDLEPGYGLIALG